MQQMRVRKSVRNYTRDTYLGTDAPYNQSLRLIDCAIGTSQCGVSDRIFAAHAAYDLMAQTRYPEMFYDRFLKPAIIMRFDGSGLLTENVFFGHGSFNLAERLIHKLIEPGIMLGVGPQFNEIPSEFVAAGGAYKPIPMQAPDYEFPFDELMFALQRGDISVLYIDNPNNPLGRHVSLDEIRMLTAEAERNGTIVLVDEAYGDYVDDAQSAAHIVSQFSNLAVTRSFSKGLGLAAARVGYMFLSTPLAHLYRPLDVPFEPTLYSANLAFATVGDQEFVERVRSTVQRVKSTLTPLFKSAGLTVLPTHPKTSILTLYGEGWNVVQRFAAIGVSVEPGSAFRRTHASWNDSYCRLRLPKEEDVAELGTRLQKF